MAERTPLDDDALIAILRKEEQAAALYQWSALSETREYALKYYNRQPYGDEQEGASAIVTSEFADVIESLMPSMIRVFAGVESSVEFAPTGPGEEPWARQASDYVSHVFMRENEGFRILCWLIKDALMFRLGGVTVDLEDTCERRRIPVQALPQDAIDLIVAGLEGGGAELAMELEQDPAPMITADPVTGLPLPPASRSTAMEAPTFSGTITVARKRRRVVADNIAPEDILFTPTAREQDKASFLGFRKKVTASDLVEMGLQPDEVDELRSDRPLMPEEYERDPSAFLAFPTRDVIGDSERPLWIVQAYLRADVDGDGISEMMRVVYAHAGGAISRLIEVQEWEGPASIALATPILMSHVIVGRSLFDQTQDLQEIGSALTRGLLDNLYLTNRPRPVVSDQVNLETLLDWLPGSPIRLKANARPGDGHVQWMTAPSVLAPALQAMEYFQTVRENRTGAVRNNQGLDADSLNKTASGMNMLMGAAQQRVELIARTLAEMAIKRLYRLIYRAIKRAADGPVHYWAGQGFAQVDPTQWPDDMDLAVNVGAGTRDQAMQGLAQVAMAQEKLVQLQGGAGGPYVTPENIANVAERMANTLGYRTPGLFFQPPQAVQAHVQQMAATPQPPNPQMAHEIMRAQADQATTQAKSNADMLKLTKQQEMDRESAAFDLQMKQLELQIKQLDLERKREQLAHERHMAQFKTLAPAAPMPEVPQ
jgi:hypothetical protein